MTLTATKELVLCDQMMMILFPGGRRCDADKWPITMHACGQPSAGDAVDYWIFELPSRSNFPDFTTPDKKKADDRLNLKITYAVIIDS